MNDELIIFSQDYADMDYVTVESKRMNIALDVFERHGTWDYVGLTLLLNGKASIFDVEYNEEIRIPILSSLPRV